MRVKSYAVRLTLALLPLLLFWLLVLAKDPKEMSLL